MDMIGSTNKRFTILRGGYSFAKAIESFLDPLLAVGLLLLVAYFSGDAIDNKFALLGLLIFSVIFPGDSFLHERPRRIIRKVFFDWIFIAGLLLAFGYASEFIFYFTEKSILIWLVLVPVASVAAQLAVQWLLPSVLDANGQRRRAVIAGCNEVGLRLAKNFHDYPHEGIELIGVFDDRDRSRLSDIGKQRLLGTFSDLPNQIHLLRIDHIYLALPMASQPRILKLLDDLKDTTVSIFFAPDIFVTDLIQGRLSSVGGMPVVAVCETPFTGFNGVAKRIMDVVLAAAILVLISPILLIIAAAVKLTSPGPVIFKQRRYGLDGKEILVYKFRSMTVTEDGHAIQQAQRNDSRVTPLGAFLRKNSLDELPQFFNVLQGRMSIVGPRPHAIAHNETYRKLIKGYMVRHKVKPGITGWAQVNGFRGETETIEKMQSRINFDLEYLRSWSLSLDLWIIIKTLLMIRGDKQAY
jgi:putative colanic acid biosysnthesis UDP-glucose lipid carrier transferase